MRRIVYSLILICLGFGAGAAVGQYSTHRQEWVPPVEGPIDSPATGGAEGERDPKADLQDQMMWDPNTRTYQGD